MNVRSDVKFAAAEVVGAAALLAALFGHILLMWSERVSGVGLFLIPATVIGYALFTYLSRRRSSEKGYWILYAVKIAFVVCLLISAPLISRFAARLVNG